jgi:hypothetical protein
MPLTRADALARSQRILRCGLAAGLALGGVAALTPVGAAQAAATPAQRAPGKIDGAIGLRLLDIPASAAKDSRARLYIVDHLAPGKIIERRIELTNTTTRTAHVTLYAAAANIVSGAFLGADDHAVNELSTWTSVRPGSPAVPAGGRLTATVRIKVPKDAPPGEQLGVVWAEARSAPETGGAVVQVNRVGIRLYLSVGPGNAPAAKFTIDSLTAVRDPDGRPKVLATVHNTGGRALDISGTLRLSNGPGGLAAGPFPADLGTTLAIGSTAPVVITLDKQVPAGPWDAKITLRSGLIESSARATIAFPAVGMAAAVPVEGRSWRRLYILAAAVAIVLLAAVIWMILRRRRRTTRVQVNIGSPRRTWRSVHAGPVS